MDDTAQARQQFLELEVKKNMQNDARGRQLHRPDITASYFQDLGNFVMTGVQQGIQETSGLCISSFVNVIPDSHLIDLHCLEGEEKREEDLLPEVEFCLPTDDAFTIADDMKSTVAIKGLGMKKDCSILPEIPSLPNHGLIDRRLPNGNVSSDKPAKNAEDIDYFALFISEHMPNIKLDTDKLGNLMDQFFHSQPGSTETKQKGTEHDDSIPSEVHSPPVPNILDNENSKYHEGHHHLRQPQFLMSTKLMQPNESTDNRAPIVILPMSSKKRPKHVKALYNQTHLRPTHVKSLYHQTHLPRRVSSDPYQGYDRDEYYDSLFSKASSDHPLEMTDNFHSRRDTNIREETKEGCMTSMPQEATTNWFHPPPSPPETSSVLSALKSHFNPGPDHQQEQDQDQDKERREDKDNLFAEVAEWLKKPSVIRDLILHLEQHGYNHQHHEESAKAKEKDWQDEVVVFDDVQGENGDDGVEVGVVGGGVEGGGVEPSFDDDSSSDRTIDCSDEGSHDISHEESPEVELSTPTAPTEEIETSFDNAMDNIMCLPCGYSSIWQRAIGTDATTSVPC